MSLQVLRSAVAGRISSGHAAGSAQGRFLHSSASDRFKKLDEAKRADIMKGVRQLREKMQKDFANDVEMLKETLTNHSYFDRNGEASSLQNGEGQNRAGTVV
uniref:Uncharacterized protein n=1 Tax=Oryza punctata TaxID=4537 RepID=A0A0E0LGA1_ORYPU